LLGVLKVYSSDENALLRQKMVDSSVEHMAPLLSSIIREGIQAGDFSNPYPDQISQAVLYYLFSFGELMLKMIFPEQPARVSLSELQNTVLAFTDAIERILGTKPGTFHLIDIAHRMGEFVRKPPS
jgi:hypothetical protein